MKFIQTTTRSALGVALLVVAVSGGVAGDAAAADPHYERLQRQGIFALQKNDPERAVRDLRLACFGQLTDPERLAGCLGYLALAEAAAEDDDAFERTFQRLVGLEERFGVVGDAAAALPDGVAARLTAEIERRIPAELLAGVRLPGLVAPGDTAAPTSDPVVKDVDEPAAPAASITPTGEAEAKETDGAGDAGVEPANEPDVVAAETVRFPAPALGPEAERQLDRARELLAAARVRADLAEPYRLAREVADAHPAEPEAQHLAALIAYRSARWAEASDYFERGGEPNDPAMRFYFAVALYESGEHSAAADLLRRALPELERSEFVSAYEARILGAATEASPSPPSS